jgi:hypothetical protein
MADAPQATAIKQFDPSQSYLVGGALLNELLRVSAGLRPFLDIKTSSLDITKGTNTIKIDVKVAGVDLAKLSTTVLQTCDGPVTVVTVSG